MSTNPFALSNIEQGGSAAAPATANPFALQSIQQDQQQDLRTELQRAVRTNPDHAAEVDRLAQRYPAPKDVLLRNLQDVQLQAAVDAADEKLGGSPKLADYMRTSPWVAKQSHDDLDALTQVAQFFSDTGGSVKAGVFNAAKGASGLGRAAAEFAAPPLDILENVTAIGGNPLRRLAEGFAMLAEQNAASAKAAAPKTTGILDSGFQSGVQSLTQNLLALPMAFAPGGQGAALSMMTANTGGGAYQDAREKGLPMSQAIPFAASQAAIEYATEKLPLGALLKDVKAGTPFLETLARQVAMEVPGEQVATILQDLNEWAVLNPDKPFTSYLDERPSAAAQTLVATIVGAGGNVAVVKGIEKALTMGTDNAAKIADAERVNAGLQAAMQAAAASKLRERNPETFKQLVQHLADNGDGTAPTSVFIDAQVLAQSGVNVAEVFPSVADQMEAALATNGSVEVAISEVLTAAPGTPLEQVFLQNARGSADGISMAEAEQAFKQADQWKAEADRVMAEAQDQAAWQQSADNVKANLLGQLNTAGRFTPDVNEAYATMVRDFYATMAGRQGITPEEMFAKYPLRIAAQGMGGQQLDQALPDFASMRDKIAQQETLNAQRPEGHPLRATGERALARLKSEYDAATAKHANTLAKLEGSKLVDARGNPLVVYHGGGPGIANTGKFKRKDGGRALWFSNTQVAGTYAGDAEGSTMYPVLPVAKNPLVFDANGATWQELTFEGERLSTDDLAEIAEQRGHDALVIKNLRDENTDDGGQEAADHIALFKPEQAVSAISGETLAQSAPFNGTEQATTPIGDATEVEVDGQMRPALNSNGQPIHWSVEGVRNFWRWFGDSRVVDKTGRPVPVFHGSTADIEAFDPAQANDRMYSGGTENTVFFTDNADVAASYAGRRTSMTGLDATFRDGGNVTPVYLKISKPLKANAKGENWQDVPYKGEFYSTAELTEVAKSEKKDGMVVSKVIDHRDSGITGDKTKKPSTTYAVFNPTQIKSAIGNDGTFSGQNANILMQSGQTDEATGLPLNPDGTVTVYHHTSAANAQAIRATGRLKSQAEPDVYVTTRQETDTGYGDTAVPIRVKPELLQLDDEFPDGRQDFRIDTGKPGGSIRVQVGEYAQAARGTFNPEQMLLTLNENADLSTFLHESGHFFLEVMADLASQPNAPTDVADDMAKLLKWFGIKADALPEVSAPTVSDNPEKWTIKNDEYTRGVAPTAEKVAEGEGFVLMRDMRAAYNEDGDGRIVVLNRSGEVVGDFSYGRREDGKLEATAEVAPAFRRNGIATTVYDWIEGFTGEKLAPAENQTPYAAALWKSRTTDRTPLEVWNAMTLDQKRPHHERFAESFEQYLLEGKAPSAELQPLFRRFRAWMVNVYKSLTHFMRGRDLKLSDEVRQVFDRMLAAEDAITQQEEASGLLPDFDATNEAIEKLQARSLRDLKWTVNARSRALKALQKEAALLRKAVEDEVRAEVEDRPEVKAKRALDELRKSTPEYKAAMADWKAQRQGVVDAAAEEIKTNLLATEGAGLKGIQKGQFLAKNKRRIANEAEARGLAWERDNAKPERTMVGSDVEIATVAEANGYESTDAMLAAIDQFGDIKAAVEGMTDQRMLENFGELATPEAIEAAANDAVHNEARAKSLATELKAQADMLNVREQVGTATNNRAITVNAIAKAAKEFAANLAARRKVKDLKGAAAQHRAAETKAGKRWQEATAKADTQAAVAAKRDQVLNNATVKALNEAQAEAKKIVEFFRKVTKDGNEKLVDKGRDPDVVNAMRAILAAYDVAPRLEKGALEYMELVAKNDPTMYAALQPSVQGAMNNAKPMAEMTVEELRGLHDELQAMWHLAKRSRQMEVDGNLLDIEDAADELVTRMDAVGIPLTIPGERSAITASEEAGIKLQFAKAILSRVEQWAERMDGKFGGPFLRLVFQPVKDAADRYRTARATTREKFTQLVEAVGPFMPRGPIDAPELGYTFGNARDSGTAELLHAIIHTGNDSNKRKLLLGRGWATENPDGTLDTSRWDAFITRMHATGKLTKAHYDFAQGVWDLLEQTKPLAQETHRKVFGRYFAEVTANGFETPFGAYRGGYAPAQTDSRLVKDAKLRELAEGENESMAYAFPASPSGFTKGRVEYNKPLLLDLRALAQHMDKVLLFSHMQGAVVDVRRLLTNKRVSYALDRMQPGAYEGMLIPWLNRAAKQIVETPVVGDRKLSRFLSAARSRAGMALMFANLSNTVQQITGFSLAAVKVKPSLLMSATGQFVASPKATKAAVAAASPYMRDRMLNEVSAMNDVVETILIDPTLLERGQAWTQRHAYFMQSAVDNTMSPIIWTAAYNQAIAEKQTHDDAVRFADGVIRQTQGSTLPEDISRFESGPGYARLFTQFVSYFNMMANTNATAVKQIADEMGLRKGAGKLAYIALAGLLAPIWVAEAIAQAFKGGPDDEDDDGYLDDWLVAVFGMGTMRGLTAMVPLVGQGAQLVVNRFNDNPADDKFSLSPAVSLIEGAVSSPASVYKAIMDDGNAQKAVRDVAAAATLITGLPVYAAARPVGYLAGVAQGKIEPTSEVDAVRGALTGNASKDSKN